MDSKCVKYAHLLNSGHIIHNTSAYAHTQYMRATNYLTGQADNKSQASNYACITQA